MDYTERRIVGLHRLTLQAVVGFYPEEKAKPQRVEISFRYEVDRPKADDVKESVCYAELAKEITALMDGSDYNLIETVADEVMNIIWKRSKVKWAEVTVAKPDAPVTHTAGGSSIVLERRRK
jgi:dihydroneopterin aldolase